MELTIEFFRENAWQTIDPATSGVIPGPIVERHLADYSWSFRHRTVADLQVYANKTPVRLTADGDIIFTGIITKADREGSPSSDGIIYRCESWWFASSIEILKVSGIPRVVYNARPDDQQHDTTRYQMTVEEILDDAAALAETAISAFTLANFKLAWGGLEFDDDLDFVPPKTVFDGSSLQQVIIAILKWAPDTYLRIDRETGTFRFTRRASTTVHNITLQNFDTPAGATIIERIRLNPRLDLVVPEIKLSFPEREEWWSCYIDDDLVTGTPDYLLGVPETLTKLNDLQWQVPYRPMAQLIEVVGGGPYNISLSTGIITFRDHPSDFFIRWIAEASQNTYDTGLGGTGYSDYAVTVPIVERYLQDFPRLTRKFYIQATDGAWLFCPAFGESFPDPLMWDAILDATNATVIDIAYHTFSYQSGNAAVVVNAIGIQVSSGISGSFVSVVVEDNSGPVTELADSLWRALRDVRWEGDLPTFKWMPQLDVGARINLLNTNDTKMATMQEVIYELQLDPVRLKTRVMLASNPWLNFDDLLSLLREKLPPENFKTSNSFQSGAGGGGMRDHTHESGGTQGGKLLKPKQVAMNGATATDDQIRNGADATGTRMMSTAFVVGDYPTGDFCLINKDGFQISYGGKSIAIGKIASALQVQIDGLNYIVEVNDTRILKSRIDGS